MRDIQVGRRTVLRGLSGAAIAGALMPIATACGGDSQATNESTTSTHTASTPTTTDGAGTAAASGSNSAKPASVLPTYTPFTGFAYDLPATADGIDAALLNYPDASKLVSSSPEHPGGGLTLTTMAAGISQLPPPVGKNKFWQELNKRLDATMKFNYPGKGSQYTAKLATTLAGGDLPDFVELTPAPAHLPDILAKDFQDLSEFLSGDAVKKYSNLANIPPAAWQGAIYNNKVYALPRPRTIAGATMVLRSDIAKKVGAPQQLASGQDFLDLCAALTDVKASRWAVTNPLALLSYVQQMCGAPNQWKISDGTFTSAYEADETRTALGLVAQMWKSGVIYPDAFVNTTSSYKLTGAGTTALMIGSFAQWLASVRDFRPDQPEFDMAGLVLPKWDGGGASQQYLGAGFSSIMAMKKTSDKSRIERMLAVANWIAAPYGTTERDFLSFGIDGWDSKTTAGKRALTDTGSLEMTSLDVTVIAGSPYVIYAPGTSPDDVKSAHQWEQDVVPNGLPLPTTGLFSETYLDKWPSLEKSLQDVQADVIQGRKGLADWDSAVKSWKGKGGDQVAKEYSESYAASH